MYPPFKMKEISLQLRNNTPRTFYGLGTIDIFPGREDCTNLYRNIHIFTTIKLQMALPAKLPQDGAFLEVPTCLPYNTI